MADAVRGTPKSFSFTCKTRIYNPIKCISERSDTVSPSPCRNHRPARCHQNVCYEEALHRGYAKVKRKSVPAPARKQPRNNYLSSIIPELNFFTGVGSISNKPRQSFESGTAACQGAALCFTDTACPGPILSSFSLVLPITSNEAKGATLHF